MPRIRTVKPEFFAHEELGRTPFAARLLAIGLMQIADGHGRMRWIPKAIDAHVFPWDDVSLEPLAVALEGAGFLVRYTADGRRYGVLPNFRKHQRITGKEADLESKYPSSTAGNTQVLPHCFPGKHLDVQEQGTGNREQGTGKREQAALVLGSPPKPDPVLTVWAGYVEGRSNQRKAPGKDARRDIAARLRADATVEDLVLVSRWVLNAPDWYCGKQRESGNTTYSTIFKAKGMEDRIDKARAWESSGAPKAPAGRPEGGSAAYVEWMRTFSPRLWGDVGRLLQSGRWKRETLRESLDGGGFDRMIRPDEPACPDPARAISWLCAKSEADHAA